MKYEVPRLRKLKEIVLVYPIKMQNEWKDKTRRWQNEVQKED